MYLALVLISVGLLCVAWNYYLNRRKKHPPNLPSPYPIIGYSYYLHTTVEEIWPRLRVFMEQSKKCGRVGNLTIGPYTVCVVCDPDVAAKILNTCFDKDYLYDLVKVWLGDGLFSGPVPIWKPNRKLILPSLNQRILDDFVAYFNSEGKRFVEKLSSKVNIKEVDLMRDCALLNLRIFLRTQMGLTLDDDDSELDEYLIALDRFHFVAAERFVRPALHVDLLFDLFGGWIKKEQIKMVEIMDKLPERIIKNSRKLLKENNINNNMELKDKSTNGERKMIDILMELNEKGVMSDKHLKDEIHTNIFGGHDTSAGTMVFALIMIGSYPEVQKKIMDEMKQVLKNKDDDVKKEDLSKLVYLEAAIKESMRMYPIMGFIGRIVDREMKFENYSLYPGTRCIMFPYEISRHPVWGPDAEEYRPERWLDPSSLPHGAAFLPFSWGKRSCIGKTYALMSIKTTLSHILRNYKLTANHKKMVLTFVDTVKPKHGHELMLERRTDY